MTNGIENTNHVTDLYEERQWPVNEISATLMAVISPAHTPLRALRPADLGDRDEEVKRGRQRGHIQNTMETVCRDGVWEDGRGGLVK